MKKIIETSGLIERYIIMIMIKDKRKTKKKKGKVVFRLIDPLAYENEPVRKANFCYEP